ncbi:MAG TPA: protein kinase [Kofleriaceae bacterium]|nr:protein kinase [Kofleriaceae bacterium]
MASELVMECPSDELLGALVEHTLAAPDADAITSHLDRCDTCRAIVVAAVRAAVPGPRDARPSFIVPVGSAPLATGAAFGRYRVRALLGAGGMGQVYEAYDGELDRAVALKILRPEIAGAAALLAERLRRESRLMAQVSHPAVIAVYDAGREGNAVFVAMELVRGETLGAHIARTRPAWRDALALFARAGEGLAAAHAAGIVHRDFKPENVLVELDDERRAKRLVVTDFGIARRGDERDSRDRIALDDARDVRLTATGAAIGTPAYMPPEQLEGRGVDARADVFAFAVSLWEALFGARPFIGATVDQIRAAMNHAPKPTRRGVPARIVRALERGLAIDPDARWPDLRAMLDALSPPTRRGRILAIAAAVVATIAIAVAAEAPVRARSSPPDACASALAEVARAYDPIREAMVGAALAADPAAKQLALAQLATRSGALAMSHVLTCRVSPPPSAAMTACLDARRTELTGFVADLIESGPRWASRLAASVVDPTRCLQAPPGLTAANVPDDPALRRSVRLIREREFAIEDQRDRGDFAGAIAGATALVEATKQAWPPMQAEALYLLGTAQSFGGNNAVALDTLRRAVAAAESAHDDYIAASALLTLGLNTTFDEGSTERGLEYLAYARAVLDRLGHPDDFEVQLLYAQGSSLVNAKRFADAEAMLRRALAIAESTQPAMRGRIIQGLGYLYEDEGRYEDAIAQFRRAIALGPAKAAGEINAQIIYRERLASDLSSAGHDDEAIRVARDAVALADRQLGGDNLDRWISHSALAQTLDGAGQLDEALREAHVSTIGVRGVVGDRQERYGEVLQIEGAILDELGRFREAVIALDRACDVIAFGAGDTSSEAATCWLQQASARSDAGNDPAAMALVEKALPVLVSAYGELHPVVANAYLARGAVRAALGQRDGAIADFQRAADDFGKLDADIGHLAGAEYGLAKELWPRDHARAERMLRQALDHFTNAGATWKDTRDEAAEWLATDGHPAHPSPHGW